MTLDGSESSALGAPIKEYKWKFGNGDELTTNESSTEYSWNLGGFYNVTLTVVDEEDDVLVVEVVAPVNSFLFALLKTVEEV